MNTLMICAKFQGQGEARFYLLKSHIPTYTKKDGTVVVAHDDSRVAGHDVVRGRLSWEVHKDGNKIADYRASIPKNEVLNYHFNQLDIAEKSKETGKLKAKESKKKNDAIKATLAKLKAVMDESRGVIESAHMNRNLQFRPMPLADFSAKDTVSIFQSGGYGKKKGSEYRLVMIGDRPAYARESDHWGKFSTVERGLQVAPKLEEGDSYDGEEHWKQHNWRHEGAGDAKFGVGERHAGYVFLDDLIAMKGETTMRKSMPQDFLQSIPILFLKRHSTTNS